MSLFSPTHCYASVSISVPWWFKLRNFILLYKNQQPPWMPSHPGGHLKASYRELKQHMYFIIKSLSVLKYFLQSLLNSDTCHITNNNIYPIIMKTIRWMTAETVSLFRSEGAENQVNTYFLLISWPSSCSFRLKIFRAIYPCPTFSHWHDSWQSRAPYPITQRFSIKDHGKDNIC